MNENEFLAARFEDARPHLRLVAQRVLGSSHEAEDAVQEAWLRLSRSDTSDVENLTGWLTTVVSRICLDMLRSRSARHEDAAELPPDMAGTLTDDADPERDAVLADALGPALMLVLDTLNPAERLAFVLHDLFAVSFPEIAQILGVTPAAARQLASRSRRRVQGRDAPAEGSVSRRREIVDAFLAASRGGHFTELLALLHPDAVVRSDEAGIRMGTNASATGARAVAEFYSGRAKAARLALLDGQPGLVWQLRGEVKVAFRFTVTDGLVSAIDLVADPATIAAMHIETNQQAVHAAE